MNGFSNTAEARPTLTDTAQLKPGYWTNGELPPNVRIGLNSIITGDYLSGDLAFRRFFSRVDPALTIGAHCTMDGVLFNVGEEGRVEIGDYCFFMDAFLVCDVHICIGNHVIIGWHATIADSDFHPISPTERLADVAALSPLGKGRTRPPFERRPVVIEDDVWIGPNATILKGVRVGAGAFVEAGAVVIRDVPPRTRVLGNPAQVIEEV
jgi:acetyltransferase-like isoleucine patch superfamily enzyme